MRGRVRRSGRRARAARVRGRGRGSARRGISPQGRDDGNRADLVEHNDDVHVHNNDEPDYSGARAAKHHPARPEDHPRLNPGVRQSTIKKTICKSGWTKTIRTPVGYTNALKIQQMVLYGEMGSPSEYEEDHFIPLELGGAPKNPKNLWPEPHSQSKLSDPLETQLKRKVCKGLMKLAKARAAIRIFKNTQG